MSPVPVSLPFADRAEAGRGLAERVRPFAVTDPVVLALPRGGVPVGAELARRLGVPLDVLLVRKIGLPGHSEYGVGAIAEDGHACLDHAALARHRIAPDALAPVVEEEREELRRRLRVYRGGRSGPVLTGRDVIVVDDGAATGGTARAALRMVRRRRPARLVLAVPVASPSALQALRAEADETVVLSAPENFQAVGEWYRDFEQLTDAEVTALLAEAVTPGEADTGWTVHIEAGGVRLDGDLVAPEDPEKVRGAAVLGLGHERHAAQQRAVAAAMRDAGFATLLLDLITPQEWEESQGAPEIGSGELGARLAEGVRWLRGSTDLAGPRVALFGSGAAAPAALAAAAAIPADVGAVAVLGGRIDMAEEHLPGVRAPTLVLVPGEDSFIRELTEWAVGRMPVPAELRVVPGAEGLLPGGEEGRAVGGAVAEWFARHL
ncbi:phosphoribosyltransferase [Nocardiopsis sp. CNT-189]|uniref:phosphoribosyltransferase family protein n=1 Tax=Nocardiopsis oceanisediminis TaxID=2816862 RepID=UPI003B36CBAC